MYGKRITYTCPIGYVLELPSKDNEQDFKQTKFDVRCDADARWRPVLNHSKMPDLPVMPTCIRE